MQVRLDRGEIEEAVTGYIDLMYSTPVEISEIQVHQSGTSISADVQFTEPVEERAKPPDTDVGG